MEPDAAAFRRITALVRQEAILLARAPGPLIGYTIVPIVLMTVLRPMLDVLARTSASEVHGTAHAATGMAVMFSLFAMKVVAAGFLDERTWHTWDRLRASPASGVEILVGKAAPLLGVLALHQTVIVGFAMAAFGLRPSTGWWPLAVTIVAWSACILVLGIAAATLVRTPAQLSVSGDIAAVLTSVLGGALVPPALLPGWLQLIGPASPGYWAMQCYRSAFSSVGPSSMTAPLAALGVFVAVGIAVSASLLRGRGD